MFIIIIGIFEYCEFDSPHLYLSLVGPAFSIHRDSSIFRWRFSPVRSTSYRLQAKIENPTEKE